MRFRKIAKSNFRLHVRLSVHMEQQQIFKKNWYLSVFLKSVEKIQVPLKSDKNNGYFTWRPL